MKNPYFIGVDIGGTKMAAAVVKDNGNILSLEKTPTPRNARPEQIYNLLIKLIEKILFSSAVEREELQGIGLGVPGIVDSSGEKILAAPNINLAGFSLYQNLSRDLNIPVAIGNDVNVGLLGEKWLGGGRKYNNLIGLFPGTGIGGAIIINGRLYPGAYGGGGELGHMIIDRNGPRCSCKNKGCLEALASRWAIERDINAQLKKGKKTLLAPRGRKYLSQIKSKALKEALKAGDRLTVEVMSKTAEVLADACVSLRHIFDPQVIILGGGVIEACGKFLLPIIQRTVNEDPFFAHLPACEVVVSELGDEAVILGAVALVKDKLMFQTDNHGIKYPHFYFQTRSKIVIEDQQLKENIYIRSDGKQKKFNSKEEFEEFMKSHLINLSVVKKICKNAPKVFIIGTQSSRLALTEEAKQYLNKKDVKVQILPIKEAISVYNAMPEEKSFLLHMKS